jgi:hypothetical protein
MDEKQYIELGKTVEVVGDFGDNWDKNRGMLTPFDFIFGVRKGHVGVIVEHPNKDWNDGQCVYVKFDDEFKNHYAMFVEQLKVLETN